MDGVTVRVRVRIKVIGLELGPVTNFGLVTLRTSEPSDQWPVTIQCSHWPYNSKPHLTPSLTLTHRSSLTHFGFQRPLSKSRKFVLFEGRVGANLPSAHPNDKSNNKVSKKIKSERRPLHSVMQLKSIRCILSFVPQCVAVGFRSLPVNLCPPSPAINLLYPYTDVLSDVIRNRGFNHTDLFLRRRFFVALFCCFRFRVGHVTVTAWRHRLVGVNATVIWVWRVDVTNL